MVVRFEDVITRITGNVDRYNTELEYYVGGDQYDSSALTIERRGDLKKDVDILGFKFHFPFKSGDVLLMARNPHLRKAGQVFFDGLCSDASYILRTKDENRLRQNYIPLILQSNHFWDWFESHKTGGITFLMNWGMLKTYEFELPSTEDQDVIMTKVWAAYKLKQSYQALIAATDEMVKSRFFSQFGELPFDHKWKDVLTIINGKAYGEEYKDSGSYPICGSGGIMGYGEKRMCDRDTIILGRKGNIDKPIYMTEDYWIVDTAFCLCAHPELVHPVYLYYWCKQFDFQKLNKQAVLPSLTRSDLEQIDIQVPEMTEQLAFVEIVRQADKSKYLN